LPVGTVLEAVPAGNPSAYMAGGAWGPSGPPVTSLRPGLQPAPSATRSRSGAVKHSKETDAMNESDILSVYTVVESINDDASLPDLNYLLGILKRMRGCEGADGHPWPETDVSPGRRVSLARSERAMVGALTVLELLHAADRCRVAADPERHLDEGVVDGLFLACRGLVEWACREVRPE